MLSMTWLVENRAILDGYREGDAGAWEAVYLHYVDDLRRFASRGFSFESKGKQLRFAGLRDPLDVEDIVQEVFVRAFSRSARTAYDGLHSFRNYLLAIARNLILGDLRRSARYISADNEDRAPTAAATSDGEGSDPEQQLMEQQLIALTRTFQQSLSHHDQRLFALRFQQCLSQDETGRRMKLTRAKVRTQEKRIRRRLVRFLRKNRFLESGGAPAALSAMVTILQEGVP